MGFFKALGGVFSAAIDVAVLPIDIAKDVLTLGGAATDEPCATKERLEDIYDQLKEAADDLGED